MADLLEASGPTEARAAVKCPAEDDDDMESYACMLLTDIRDLFEERKTDNCSSQDYRRCPSHAGG